VDFDRENGVSNSTDTLTSTAPTAFLAKYDPSGGLLWVHSLDGASGAAGIGMAIDARGNTDPSDDWVYVTGSYQGGATYSGAGPLPNDGNFDAFLLKVDAQGAPLAFTSLNPTASPGGVVGSSLAVGPGGHVLVGGSFRNTVDFDPSAGTF